MENILAVSNTMMVFYVSIPVILALIIIFICQLVKSLNKKWTAVVLNTSTRLEAINQINLKYSFDNSVDKVIDYYEKLNSKPQFDKFNFDKAVLSKIANNKSYYEHLFEVIDKNILLFNLYENELSKLPNFASAEKAKTNKVPYKSYIKIERRLCYNVTLAPIISSTIDFTINYTSPAGRNSYTNSMRWNYNEIKELYKQVLADEEYKNSKQYQRRILTADLRYQILKRDNFTCVLCGRTAEDGVKLHVDHIKPIAKGGKTVPENLRTLCSECNFGKSDKYDEFGIN